MRLRRKNLIWFGPLALVAIAGLIAIGGEIVMQLWNWLAPAMFGWREITFWQALGVLVLCRILFGGHHWRGRGWRGRMRDRWESMTPEERERFREGMRGRCGAGPASTETPA
jgi:hypothetical protein